ncbi:MAG: sensor histidine kinase, partial [Bacteroidetes bacterium]
IQKRNNQLLLLGGGRTVFGLLITLLFFINRKNQQLNQQKIEVLNREQETKLLKAILKGEEKERIRIGRELHDGLGAVLATVKMFISNITYNTKDNPTKATFQKAESMVDDACKTVREISHDLMPGVLEEQGLRAAMENLCKSLTNKNTTFYYYFFGDENALDEVVKPGIFRITQELLKNTVKHAEASEVIVQLSIEEDMITLEVEDDGKGFDTSINHEGIGLKNIRSRTEFLKGILHIESTPEQGSTFTIQVPLN